MNYEKIFKDNEGLIWKIASGFYGVDKNDLYQAGCLGIMKALKKYNTNSLTKFSTFAYDYIFGEMYLLSSNREIKVSKDILRLVKKIENARYIYAQKYAKIPSNYELSLFLELPLKDIENALKAAASILSLDSKVSEDEGMLYDTIKADTEDIDTKILVSDSMNALREDERSIIWGRYFEDLTQSEVAKKLKMTQAMVSRYEKRSLEKMRDYLKI